MTFASALEAAFPGARPEGSFLDAVSAALAARGFHRDNTIACVGVCRDEICYPFLRGVRERWGEAFNLCGLGAMIFAGKTGFSAAIHHAPDAGERHRFVFFHLPHVALGEGGEPGVVHRRGQAVASGACGALLAFRKELASGHVRLSLDPDDPEQSLLKQALLSRIPYGQVPDILALTRLVHEAGLADVERMIGLTVDAAHSDWAVVTGIQVHGPMGADWAWPGTVYTVIRGQRGDVSL